MRGESKNRASNLLVKIINHLSLLIVDVNKLITYLNLLIVDVNKLMAINKL